MNFYSLAERIANGDVSPLESYLRHGYDQGTPVQLLTPQPYNLSYIYPNSEDKEWYRLAYSRIVPFNVNPTAQILCKFRLQIQDSSIVAQFIESLGKCQTLADLILATQGEARNVAAFKTSLNVIRDRISIMNLEKHGSIKPESILEIEKRTNNLLEVTSKVICLCKEFRALNKAGSLSAPFTIFERKGIALPFTHCTQFTDENLIDWASNLSSKQKEKVVFFDFNNYPELTPEVPFKLKQIFPNLSFFCFGSLPDSMCDVTLIGDTELNESAAEEEFEVRSPPKKIQEKGKEKEVRDEKTGCYYFPSGNKRKPSYSPQNLRSLKKQKLSSNKGASKETEVKEKEKVNSEGSLEEADRPTGIKVNKKILASSSEFFNQLFYGGFNEENKTEILLRDVRPGILKKCLDAFFLRTDLKNESLETLFEVYKTSFYLELKAVKALAEAQIIRLLEVSLEELFVERGINGEKEAEEVNPDEKNARDAENTIQTLGQCYLDVSHIFLQEPKNLLKKNIIQFLQKKFLSIDVASYKNLFRVFLEAGLPLVEVIEELQAKVSIQNDRKEEIKDLDKLYMALWQSSLELNGQSFKEVLTLCRKYWEGRPNLEVSLRQHIRCAAFCLKNNSSSEAKRTLLASLLKAAQVGDDVGDRVFKIALMARTNKGAIKLREKFLNTLYLLMKSIKGDFEIPEIDTLNEIIVSHRLMELSNMVLDFDELKIRSRLAAVAGKVYPDHMLAVHTSLLYKNMKWGIEKSKRFNDPNRIIQPKSAFSLIRTLSPREIRKKDTLNDYSDWALTTQNPLALSLCSVLLYHANHQNWDKIFATSYLALQYDFSNELAHSLHGASLIQLAKVKPEEREGLLTQAKQNLDNSLKRNPKNTIALTYLANWHLAKEEVSQAKTIFKTIKNVMLTQDNFDLINHLLQGSNEEMEEGIKILERTLRCSHDKIMDLNWFHLMAYPSLAKQDVKSLKKLKTFFEACLDSGIYSLETLSILNKIYQEEGLIGPVDEEKKSKLAEATHDGSEKSNALKYHRTSSPPTMHPANYFIPINNFTLPVLVPSHSDQADLGLPPSDFNVDDFFFFGEDDEMVGGTDPHYIG
ncbi:BTB/POZ domain-containing protein [Criblamydia sequanensis]|uniref:BTB domain-containing protein n=1 Tax=Candidatus Criblamydia sequanensis CRIB-18 TaxID=1437425 RepID=A0A090CY33_9BACT|nr:BTB/POZ domain-containing protein [Criblamydia sequanensis]CDR33111.1 hypothetical protein CSEC_0272 [Criblamydia sequanensis CRIB-18]